MNYLELDYKHLPCKAKIYNKGVMIQQWSEKNPLELMDKVVDDMDITGFGKVNIKRTIRTITDVFEPKKIRIIEHG